MRIRGVGQLQAVARRRRLALGLSQEQVASAAGVSRKWVSDFERGRVPGAELTLVLRLLGALNIALDAVVDGSRSAAVRDDEAADNVDLDAHLRGFQRR